MSRRNLALLFGMGFALLVLALIGWGWQQGGLALLQLGMGIC